MGLMDSVLGKREKTEKYLPLIGTIFIVVIVSNWLGLLPGVGSLGIYELVEGKEVFVPFFRSPSADLNFTISVALIAVIGVNMFGILAAGCFRYANRFFTLKNPIYTFVGLLEFVSEFAKIISFSFRLFGNVFAGEVLLIIIGVLAPYFIPLPFLFLEIFVGFIQAFVFATLTLVFVSIATAETEH
jgi:F-type H+-transporting ATPase subunit a